MGLVYPAVWVDSEIFGNSSKAPPAPVYINPNVTDGRILTPDLTGDICDWVEIAQIDDFSLIVRKNFINTYHNAVMYGAIVRDDPAWQYTNGFGKTNGSANEYMRSGVRDKVNQWFNRTAPGDADKLPADARMRDFVAQTTTKYHLGSSTTNLALVNGFNKPTFYNAGIGNDVAFALSFGEAANFVSKSHFLRGPIAHNPATPLAIANFNKLSIPKLYSYGMWLRSPGDITGTAGFLESDFHAATGARVFQAGVNNTENVKGLVYPALWVGSGIFNTKTPCVITDRLMTKSRADINIFNIDTHIIEGDGVDPIVYVFDENMYSNVFGSRYVFYPNEVPNNPSVFNRGTYDNLPPGTTLVKDPITGLYTLTVYPINKLYPSVDIYFAYCSGIYGDEPDIIYDPQD
jgi:hypothetical protein